MDVGYLALVAGGLGIYWWKHLRMRPPRLAPLYAAEADIALHVARHEATSRHQALAPLHVLYGLLQDEEFTAAIAKLGGDAEAIEQRVHTELDAGRTDDGELSNVLSHAVATARHNERLATTTDLWAFLARTVAGKVIADDVSPVALLAMLVHGDVDGGAPPLATREVDIVLRNDDYTTQEMVVELLVEVFERSHDEAIAKMLATHREGSAVIGRFASELARDKVATAHERARARGFPLRFQIEPR